MKSPWHSLPNLRIHNGGVAVYPAGATFGPRQLTDYEFVWIMEGSAEAWFNGQPILAPAGTLLLAQPGMTDRYKWDPHRRTVHAYFHFETDPITSPWPAPAAWPLAHTLPVEDVLRPVFRYILTMLDQPEPERTTLLSLCVDLMLRSFVMGKLRLAPEPRAELPPAVEKALEFIQRLAQQDPAPATTLADLGRAAHVSPEHLSRLFRQSLNSSPLESLRRARLERAATLIRRSNLTFKEIAETTGFANAFHFSSAFKAIYEVSPREYRNRN